MIRISQVPWKLVMLLFSQSLEVGLLGVDHVHMSNLLALVKRRHTQRHL
jgi:hypothetical protein